MIHVTPGRLKTRGRGPSVRGTGHGVPGYGVPGCLKHGVWWNTRDLSGKHGVSVENTGSQWKTRGLSGKHGV